MLQARKAAEAEVSVVSLLSIQIPSLSGLLI